MCTGGTALALFITIYVLCICRWFWRMWPCWALSTTSSPTPRTTLIGSRNCVRKWWRSGKPMSTILTQRPWRKSAMNARTLSTEITVRLWMSVVYLSVHVYVIQEITAEFSGKLIFYFWLYQTTCIVCLVYINPLYTMGKLMNMYSCWLVIGYIYWEVWKFLLRYMFTCICTVNRYTLYLILIRCGEELGYVGGDEEGKPCWSEVRSEGQD